MVSLDAIDAPELTVPAPAFLDSIARHGVLEPLLVQKRERRYKLMAGRRRLAAARSVGLREAPCVVRRLTDDEARSLATASQAPVDSAASTERLTASVDQGEIASSLSTVLSCADLLGGGLSLLTRSVAVDLIRAETQRAICTLRTASYLQRGIPPASAAVSMRGVVAAVLDAVGPEVRLRGTRLSVRLEVSDDVRVFVDEQCLVSGLTAVVLLLSAGLGDVRGAGLDLTVTSHPGERVTLTISQESVILPSVMLAAANAERPARDSSVTPLVALRQLAEFGGGRARSADWREAHRSPSRCR